MSGKELTEAVRFELEAMRITIRELAAIAAELREREPTIRDCTAAGAFLAQFDMGVENILKRTHQHVAGPIPEGARWHVELFKRFCEPAQPPFPALIDRQLEADLKPFRRFRHIVSHGYGFQLDWERMQIGAERAQPVFDRFERRVSDYLDSLNRS